MMPYLIDDRDYSSDLNELFKGLVGDKASSESVFLNILIKELFHINKNHEERYFRELPQSHLGYCPNMILIEKYQSKLKEYSAEQKQNLSNELNTIYQKNIAYLNHEYRSPIRLQRAICFGSNKNIRQYNKIDDDELLAAYIIDSYNNQNMVKIELDILTSWSKVADTKLYGKIILNKDWNIEDIFLSREITNLTEPGKWLCINSKKTVIVEFSKNDIDITAAYTEFINKYGNNANVEIQKKSNEFKKLYGNIYG